MKYFYITTQSFSRDNNGVVDMAVNNFGKFLIKSDAIKAAKEYKAKDNENVFVMYADEMMDEYGVVECIKKGNIQVKINA